MVVILSKRDQVDDRKFAELHEELRKALERSLSVVWGAERVRAIPILECISVQTDHGTALIDDVRIYGCALSPQDVKALYKGREPSSDQAATQQ